MISPHETTSVPNAQPATTKDDHNDKMNDNMDDSPKGSSGTMMKDSMKESPLELVVGGLYHYWNGATMAAVYTLVMGKGRWYYGLVWGFIIHIGMMLAPMDALNGRTFWYRLQTQLFYIHGVIVSTSCIWSSYWHIGPKIRQR